MISKHIFLLLPIKKKKKSPQLSQANDKKAIYQIFILVIKNYKKKEKKATYMVQNSDDVGAKIKVAKNSE